jgi:hypothetical protein
MIFVVVSISIFNKLIALFVQLKSEERRALLLLAMGVQVDLFSYQTSVSYVAAQYCILLSNEVLEGGNILYCVESLHALGERELHFPCFIV